MKSSGAREHICGQRKCVSSPGSSACMGLWSSGSLCTCTGPSLGAEEATHPQMACCMPQDSPERHSPRQTDQIGSCNHRGSSKSGRGSIRKKGSAWGHLLRLVWEAICSVCPSPESAPTVSTQELTHWSEH